MNAKEFESIVAKIAAAKEARARAEGAMNRIKQQLKDEYGLNSIEDAVKKVAELDKQVASDRRKLDSLYEELDGLADWDSL